MVRIGDIFEIPLKNGFKAYGQYVYKDIKQGPLIQIFDLIVRDSILNLEDIRKANSLFPPVITGLSGAIRQGIWRVIGKLPVVDFDYPNFVSSHYNEKTGEVSSWFVWDGEKYSPIGPNLPNEYKKLEYLVVWSPFDVVGRIETGEYPFPYGDLIQNNKFSPREKA